MPFFLQFDIIMLLYYFFFEKKRKNLFGNKDEEAVASSLSFPSICWQPGRQKYIGSYRAMFTYSCLLGGCMVFSTPCRSPVARAVERILLLSKLHQASMNSTRDRINKSVHVVFPLLETKVYAGYTLGYCTVGLLLFL